MRTLTLSLLLLLSVLLTTGCGQDDTQKDGRPLPVDLFPPKVDLPQGSCSAANCVGCCKSGVCQTVPSSSACGYGGISCRACSAGEQCVNGACSGSTTCSATSCSKGCCNASGCQDGTTDAACGIGGKTCQNCTTNGQVCMQSACVAKNSSYGVTAVSAIIDASYTCDYVAGACDPYLSVTVGGVTKQTTVSSTSSPKWNEGELLTASASDLAKSMQVTVYDDDSPLNPDLIDSCTLAVSASDLAAGQIVRPCGTKVKDLTFKFTPK